MLCGICSSRAHIQTFPFRTLFSTYSESLWLCKQTVNASTPSSRKPVFTRKSVLLFYTVKKKSLRLCYRATESYIHTVSMDASVFKLH